MPLPPPPVIPGVIQPPDTALMSRAQQIAYYAQILNGLPGAYEGNMKKFDGYSWGDLYTYIMSLPQAANADPKTVASQVLGIEAAQRLGGNTAAAEAGLNKSVGQIEKAAANTNFAAGIPKLVSNPLDWLSNVSDFFSRLSQANTWIRIAEFVLGGALILVGVAHLAKGTEAGKAAAKAVKTVGLAAAL